MSIFKKIDLPILIAVISIICIVLFWNRVTNTKTLRETERIEKEKEKNYELIKAQEEKIKKQIEASTFEEINKSKIDENKLQLLSIDHKDSNLIINIDKKNGCIHSIKLKNMLNANKVDNVILDNEFTTSKPLYINETNHKWQIIKTYDPEINEKSILITRQFKRNNEPFILKQKFELLGANTIGYNIEIHNIGKNILNIPEINIWIGNMPSIKYTSGDITSSELNATDLYLKKGKQETFDIQDKKIFKNNIVTNNEKIKWIANYNKYIANILIHHNENEQFFNGSKIIKYEQNIKNKNTDEKENTNIITSSGIINNIVINPNEIYSNNYKYYAGPKDIKLLKDFSNSSTEVMHLAFLGLENISKIMLRILIFFNQMFGNYVIAIFFLTLIIKILIWPVSYRSNLSMIKMRKLQPIVNEIKAKYANDKNTSSKKIMELYSKENVKPFMGLLLVAIQLPIFIAFYWTLNSAVELRQASFYNIQDLTMPDQLITIFGSGYNLLPALMCTTFFIQVKLSPAPDPSQFNIMLILPILFLFILYNVSSGLLIFWTISNLLSITYICFNKFIINKGSSEL